MKNGHSRIAAPIVALLLAIAAGIIRALELGNAFDSAGYPIAGFELGLMHGFTAAAVLGAALMPLAAKPESIDYEHCFCVGAGRIAAVAAGGLLALSGFVGLMSGLDNTVRVILSAFSLVSGACIFLAIKTRGGAFAVVPVFFGCFLMLTLYVEHSGDAVLEHYGYSILAAASGTAVLYVAASSAYGVTRTRFKVAACGVCATLSAIAVVTAAVEHDIQLLAAFAALALLALGVDLAIALPRRELPAEAGEGDGEPSAPGETEAASESGAEPESEPETEAEPVHEQQPAPGDDEQPVDRSTEE